MRFILLLLISFNAFAQQNNDNSYSLVCRGGYLYQLGYYNTAYNIIFRRSPVAAGPVGEKLEPGTCAWVDRPIHTEEPLRISISHPGHDQFMTGRILDMYQACALDKKCVIRGRVRNAYSHFEISYIYPDVSILTDRSK